MPRGFPIARGLVFVLKSGETVFDWEDGCIQDILSGVFLPLTENDYGHADADADLENLNLNGRVEAYDQHTIYLQPLPEPHRSTIE